MVFQISGKKSLRAGQTLSELSRRIIGFFFPPSVASEPRKLYEMPKCSKSEKIEDALLWECPVVRFAFRIFVSDTFLA